MKAEDLLWDQQNHLFGPDVGMLIHPAAMIWGEKLFGVYFTLSENHPHCRESTSKAL